MAIFNIVSNGDNFLGLLFTVDSNSITADNVSFTIDTTNI